MIGLIKNRFEKIVHDVLTWICEFRPGNKTIYIVFDEESDLFGSQAAKFESRPSCLGKTYPITFIVLVIGRRHQGVKRPYYVVFDEES